MFEIVSDLCKTMFIFLLGLVLYLLLYYTAFTYTLIYCYKYILLADGSVKVHTVVSLEFEKCAKNILEVFYS